MKNVKTIGVVIMALVLLVFMSLVYQKDTTNISASNSFQFSQDEHQGQLPRPVDNNKIIPTPGSEWDNSNIVQAKTDTELALDTESAVNDDVDDISVTPPPPPTGDGLTPDAFNNYPGESENKRAVTALQEQFYAEPYDEIWAAETERQLMDLLFREQPVGNPVVEAACRSTFCRIDVSHSNPEAEQGFLAAFALNGRFIDDGEQGYYHREVDNNGSIRAVFYYVRKGHQLPINRSDDILKN